MTTIFEMRRITKVFGRHVALKGLSLHAEAGQVIALLGENGAGKTTAIKILLGLLRQDGGTSRVLGMDSQISMYFDGAKALGHDVAGCIYDVIGKPKLRGKVGETGDQLAARIGQEIIADPAKYYQRTEVVRFDRELDESRADISGTVRLMRTGHAPRNVDACFKYGFGKPCPFADVCGGGAFIEDETKFYKLTDVHPELSAT